MPNPHPPRLRAHLARALGLVLCLAALPARAQPAPTEPPAPDPVQLSPAHASEPVEPVFEESSYGAQAEAHSPGATETPRYGTGMRMDVPLREIPNTVQVVDEEQIEERGAGDLNTALYYVPGLNPTWRYGGFQQVRSRGFRAILLNDGVRDNRSAYVNSAPQTGLWSLERIEVLKGPNAALYGFGSVGGVVNLIHAQPQKEPMYQLRAALGTPTQRRLSVSTAGEIAEGLTHRFDAGYAYKEDFRGLTTNRAGGSLALDYRPVRRHRFSLRGSLSRDVYNTDAGIPTIDGPNGTRVLPDDAPLNARYNPEQDRLRYQHWDILFAYEGELTPNLTLQERLTYAQDQYWYFQAEYLEYVPASGDQRPQVRLGHHDPSDPDADSSGFFFFDRHWFPLENQLDLRANFDTGPLQHQMLVGYDFTGMFNGYSDRSSNVFDEPFPTVDWADPLPIRDEVPIYVDGRDHVDVHVHSLYAHEHMRIPGGLSLTLGGRFDKFHLEARRDQLDPVTGERTQKGDLDVRDEQAVTGRAGAAYSPLRWLALYASYGTGFKPNASTAPREDRLAPEYARQIEGGVRFLSDEKLTLSAAGYKIWKRNVTVPGEMDSFETAGRVSSRGVEIDVSTQPIRQLAITGGYAFTDAVYDEYSTSFGDDLSGNRVPFVPEHTANLWVQILPIEALGLGVGGRVMGQQFGDDENTLPFGAYWLLDAAVWYEVGPVRTTLTVNNALNEGHYFVSSINQQLTPGPQREILAQVSLKL